MLVLLTGAPGAGKGTQGDLLVAKRGFSKISTGDVLRKHVRDRTEIGKAAEAIMARGDLVPDSVLLDIVRQEIGHLGQKNIILDGYPRNVSQARDLATLARCKVDLVIHLDVEQAELIRRLSGRRSCRDCGTVYHVIMSPPKGRADVCDKCGGSLTQRPDDAIEKVENRLRVYQGSTEPMLSYYKQAGCLKVVSGLGSTEAVFDRLGEILDLWGRSRT